MENSIKIVYKNKNVIIVNKPAGMPSQSDPSGDIDAMSAASELLSKMGEVPDLWLVHRLDRTVGGLIAFARNKRSAAEMSKNVAEGKMTKEYLAVCNGKPESGEMRDYLFKDSATSKAYIVKSERRGAKEAVLINEIVSEKDDSSLCRVKLITGRFHQIRAQFSARGNALTGDKKYGSRDSGCRYPALFSCRISFELFGKKILAVAFPNTEEYPWNKFEGFFENDREALL